MRIAHHGVGRLHEGGVSADRQEAKSARLQEFAYQREILALFSSDRAQRILAT